MKKIILTGGGTAGHVTPNIALVNDLKEAGFTIKYIGSAGGMETQLVKDAGLDYVGISSGKLRRYFSWKNFSDPFRVLKGYFQAKKIIKKFKPDVVFSKGGFVTVPVVFAAAKYKVPVIIQFSHSIILYSIHSYFSLVPSAISAGSSARATSFGS